VIPRQDWEGILRRNQNFGQSDLLLLASWACAICRPIRQVVECGEARGARRCEGILGSVGGVGEPMAGVGIDAASSAWGITVDANRCGNATWCDNVLQRGDNWG
jgi:hypothetical protein